MRDPNSRLAAKLGADAGCDTIGDFPQMAGLARYFDRLDRNGKLPKTIIYNLNPADTHLFAGMPGSFQDGSVPGKLQYGAAWWFLDQENGIRAQLDVLSNLGLLSRFVGMLTDSRSFLSYPRHEYFRRILCDLLGADVASGRLPDRRDWLDNLVADVCYRNAKNYFAFPLEWRWFAQKRKKFSPLEHPLQRAFGFGESGYRSVIGLCRGTSAFMKAHAIR